MEKSTKHTRLHGGSGREMINPPAHSLHSLLSQLNFRITLLIHNVSFQVLDGDRLLINSESALESS